MVGGKENRAGKEWENLAERSFWGLRRNVGTDKESEMTLEGGKKREGRCRGMILADSLSGAETQSRCITFPLVYFFLVSSQASSATGYAALFLSSRHGTRVSRLLLPSGRADNCCQDHSERDANSYLNKIKQLCKKRREKAKGGSDSRRRIIRANTA